MDIEFAKKFESIKETIRFFTNPRTLRGALYLGAASVIAACATPSRPPIISGPTSEPRISDIGYPLRWEGGQLKDPQLPADDSPLQSLAFSIDFEHNDPQYPGQSLRMLACFEGEGEYRIQSSQLEPPNMAGDLTNLPYQFNNNCDIKWPVTGIELMETDRVRLGAKKPNEPCERTYSMRTYRVTRVNEHELAGEFLGIQAVSSSDLNPREAQLRRYFTSGCLT